MLTSRVYCSALSRAGTAVGVVGKPEPISVFDLKPANVILKFRVLVRLQRDNI